jgi:hypothetical protein
VLLLNCNALPNTTIAGGSGLEHYAMLDDDVYDDDVFPKAKTSVVANDVALDRKGQYFVPQWTNSPGESSETVDCNSSDDDDGTKSGNILFEPQTVDDEHIYISTVKAVDPREILSVKRLVHGLDSNAAFAMEVDSETEEETSSSSGSSTAEDFVGAKELLSLEDCGRRRSIRFLDEIEGQQLTTIHFVPWAEHDDVNWIPRPVRCRIEL